MNSSDASTPKNRNRNKPHAVEDREIAATVTVGQGLETGICYKDNPEEEKLGIIQADILKRN